MGKPGTDGTFPKVFVELKLANVRVVSQNSSPLLSIIFVPDDYRMNDPARTGLRLSKALDQKRG
jgi:hypothetical protein